MSGAIDKAVVVILEPLDWGVARQQLLDAGAPPEFVDEYLGIIRDTAAEMERLCGSVVINVPLVIAPRPMPWYRRAGLAPTIGRGYPGVGRRHGSKD